MDEPSGKRREDVDALSEEAVADIIVSAEVVGEDGSREDLPEKGRVELGLWPSFLASAECGCEMCATDVSILREGDVMVAI